MAQPHIVMLISSLGGGGAEKVMVSLANSYSERGINVTLVTLESPEKVPDKYFLANKVSRVSIDLSSTRHVLSRYLLPIRRCLHFRDFLSSSTPDVVLSFMTPTNLLAIISTRALNICCVVSERTNPEKYSYGLLYDLLRFVLYRKANYVVAQTPRISNWLKKHTFSNAITIPNFLDQYVNPDVTCKNKTIVAVGRLLPLKGFDLLISAFAQLVRDFPEWNLVIYGDGPSRNILQKQINADSLQDRVQLCGFVKKPIRFVRHCSIFVLPSFFEGFPNALLEAMSCGCSAIATCEAGDMLIKHGCSGLLIPSGDVNALIKSLKLLMEDSLLRRSLGEAALEVRETFSKQYVMKLWDNCLLSSSSMLGQPSQ